MDVATKVSHLRKRKKTKKAKFYAVANGRKVGIYRTWDICSAQVTGYPKAAYKSFDTFDKAKSYIDQYDSSSNPRKRKREEKPSQSTLERVLYDSASSQERSQTDDEQSSQPVDSTVESLLLFFKANQSTLQSSKSVDKEWFVHNWLHTTEQVEL
eukprot:TRINITY_DN14327_c0_g1_i1.p1 TRINITY_DN14327_c0_g1~~TRINITY_DN14327_c0_g1_i1.p1  ORF type:complete len:155 (-),score=18.90 TRINITY_DN14327_c0_g1_i1:118-582(-)